MPRGRKSFFLWALALVVGVEPGLSQEGVGGSDVELNGFRMHYEIRGEGDPLLLVHGWSGNTEYFEPLLETLAASYRLIIPDLRGHGRSTNPAESFTMAGAAADLFALLDHLEIESVRALGASAGGLILLHMATLEPDRIDKMILVGVGGRFLPHCRESMAAAQAENYSQAWWDIMRTRHAYGDEQIREIVEYLRSFAENETDVNFTAGDLATIQAETLIVQGDQDWCFPPSLAAELFQGIPSANLWVIPNGEHVPILGEHASQFLDVALRFLGER